MFSSVFSYDESKIYDLVKGHKIDGLSQKDPDARRVRIIRNEAYLVPERKVMFRQNTNIEARNSKQIQIPNDKMTKTNLLKFHCFCHWNIFISVIVSDFEILILSF